MDEAGKVIREMGFPAAMKFMLQKIEKCLNSEKFNIPGLSANADDHAAQIAEDFIFQAYHRHPKRISSMNELHLQEILVTYFDTVKDNGMAYTIFRVLFGTKTPSYKIDLLFQLVSMAVGVKCGRLLDCTAAWMKWHGFHSSECISLCDRLIKDYCLLVPSASTALRSLPSVSASFTCNLITSLTGFYTFPPTESHPAFPSSLVLEIISDWISSDCTLLLESVKVHDQGNSGQTDSSVSTALPGLIRWCVMSPLLPQQTIDKMCDGQAIKKIEFLYSKLHLGVLNSLLVAGKSTQSRIEIVNVTDISKLVGILVSVLMTIPNVMTNIIVQNSLERLGQILQVAMVTRVINAQPANLKKVCERLPHNQLLTAVLSGDCSV